MVPLVFGKPFLEVVGNLKHAFVDVCEISMTETAAGDLFGVWAIPNINSRIVARQSVGFKVVDETFSGRPVSSWRSLLWVGDSFLPKCLTVSKISILADSTIIFFQGKV